MVSQAVQYKDYVSTERSKLPNDLLQEVTWTVYHTPKNKDLPEQKNGQAA